MERFLIHGRWIFILRFSCHFLQINYTTWENCELRMKNGKFLGWKLKCQRVGHVERKSVNFFVCCWELYGTESPDDDVSMPTRKFFDYRTIKGRYWIEFTKFSFHIAILWFCDSDLIVQHIIMNSWNSLFYLKKKWGNFDFRYSCPVTRSVYSARRIELLFHEEKRKWRK